LIDNACKFASQNGNVLVSLHVENEHIALAIENDGEHIPPSLREKVFDRFYQVSNGDNRDASGLGLGLAIARNFANSCGGKIEIQESRIGSKVCLRIPYIKPESMHRDVLVSMTA
jgi:signal transduction histidine kinase